MWLYLLSSDSNVFSGRNASLDFLIKALHFARWFKSFQRCTRNQLRSIKIQNKLGLKRFGVESAWSVGNQKFLYIAARSFYGCNQILTCVPNPELILIVVFFDRCADWLAVPSTQTGKNLGHVIHAEFVGQWCKPSLLVHVQRELGDRQLIEMDVTSDQALMVQVFLSDRTIEVVVDLWLGHTPGQSFHTSVSCWRTHEEAGHQYKGEKCRQHISNHGSVDQTFGTSLFGFWLDFTKQKWSSTRLALKKLLFEKNPTVFSSCHVSHQFNRFSSPS